MKQKLCLITSAQLSYNPRLLKEADALHEAGYDVRVVAVNLDEAKWRLDQALMAKRSWRLVTFDARNTTLSGKLRWLRAGIRQKLHLGIFKDRPGALETAYSRYAPELARLATQQPADLFIAHNLPALPAAAWAAKRWNSKLGFDAEDFHRGEFVDVPENLEIIRLTRSMEEKYLPHCDHLTAASDGIAEAYADCIPVKRPLTILNVFPLAERTGHTPKTDLVSERQGAGLSLYWYSQVIGPDRGLQDILQAMAQLDAKTCLSVRGRWAAGYEEKFFALAKKLGVAERVRVLPPSPPEQLVERAAQHDVGLALEPGNRQNNQLAASNKLFVFLLAGLAVAATNTLGQRRILTNIPDAGFTYEAGDVKSLANNLRIWLENPTQLRAARARARHAAESCYCWDKEKEKLINAVAKVLHE